MLCRFVKFVDTQLLSHLTYGLQLTVAVCRSQLKVSKLALPLLQCEACELEGAPDERKIAPPHAFTGASTSTQRISFEPLAWELVDTLQAALKRSIEAVVDAVMFFRSWVQKHAGNSGVRFKNEYQQFKELYTLLAMDEFQVWCTPR